MRAIVLVFRWYRIATTAFASLTVCVGRQRFISVARGSIRAGGCLSPCDAIAKECRFHFIPLMSECAAFFEAKGEDPLA